MDRRQFLLTGLILAASQGAANLLPAWLELPGRKVTIQVNPNLSLNVRRKDGSILWQTSQHWKPEIVVRSAAAAVYGPPTLELLLATDRRSEVFREGRYRGYRITMRSYPNTDVEIELVLALDADNDELLVQATQVGGNDRITGINHLYRIEKPTSASGYVVVPHGSGYLIPAEDTDRLSVDGLIGLTYTLPLFGMVKSTDAVFQIVDTYWDCSVGVEHVPGDHTSLDLNWLPSLGELGYARRFFMRFAEDLDYVGMAKLYRKRAQEQGLFRSLEDKAQQLSGIRNYVAGVEYRWTVWRAEEESRVLTDISKFKDSDLKVNFFFPKWHPKGIPDDRPEDADWQAFLQPQPTPQGWRPLTSLADAAHALGTVIKVMINLNTNVPGVTGYDASKAPMDEAGKPRPWPGISTYFAPQLLNQVLENVRTQEFHFDALYFDGYSAHLGHPEDFSPQHPLTRRKTLERQIQCFQETRRAGIIPGAEVARFWCIADCDFFFFTDWSADRLPVGEPIPLFELVFHECYAACFSGGGYGKYDWPRERHPRLYELLFGSAPGYNWMLPYAKDVPGLGLEGGVPIKDWGEPRMQQGIDWLRRWSSYYKSVAYSEMTSHEFLNSARTLQRVRFANGISAEFDMAKGLLRVSGVPGFSGDWEEPPQLSS